MSPLFRRTRSATVPSTGEQNARPSAHSARHSAEWGPVYALASKQYALFTWSQAAAAGVSRHAVRARIQRGSVEQWTPHVLCFAGAPRSFRQRCMAAVLDAGDGAAIAGLGAAALWQRPGFRRRGLDVVVAPPRRPRSRLATVRQSSLLAGEVVRLHGIPVIAPTALVCDLLGRIREERTERVLETNWAERLLTGPSFHALAERWIAERRTHVDELRALLATHPPDWVAPASGLERRFNHIVLEGGFEEPRRQVDVGDDVRWIGRVDVESPRYPVLGEINSDRYHVAPLDARSDADRYLSLVRAGFVVAVFNEEEVWYRPRVVLARWSDAHAWFESEPRGRLFLPGGE